MPFRAFIGRGSVCRMLYINQQIHYTLFIIEGSPFFGNVCFGISNVRRRDFKRNDTFGTSFFGRLIIRIEKFSS